MYVAKREYVAVCEEVCPHQEILDRVKPEMPDEERLYDLAELFKVFGDTTRIRILYVLFESEMCVCDIAALLNMNQSAISHQLKILKQARLVRNRREGKTVYYFLDDDHVRTVIGQGMEHIEEIGRRR
jgi:ArsR family transcriptional regulator